RAAGVPTGGAMDRFALAAANLLVGNREGAGGLECALSGPELEAVSPCLAAVTGADFQPLLNGHPTSTWTAFYMAPGDRLAFAGRRSGARAYIAFSGGLGGDRWLGSVGTYPLAGRGGVHGRPLKTGDVLVAEAAPARPLVAGRYLAPSLRPDYPVEPILAAIPGPHLRRIGAAGRRALFREQWAVSRDADRMGYRLDGPDLKPAGDELVSFGLAPGCLQLPQSGRPILLMADGQTAGGYPVVAAVARVDLPHAAQLLPGDDLRFREVTVEAAQAEYRLRWSALEGLRG
ncbi:MAG: biotin-dependent carboxyltransferase family protein, partial [Candidatus Dormibacteraeota bacterium]|nr:biotin-dependent carboxyltransferase family protein [Candidatus Dormibacteraeota bacterium]